MVVPKALGPLSLRLKRMPSKPSVRPIFLLINRPSHVDLDMYNGFDWYGRTLEVREVRSQALSPFLVFNA
jgi:hypothetical protein